MQLIEPHFKWSEDSSFKFQEALTSVDIQKNLSDLANSDIQNSLSSLDNAVDKLKDIIISAATRSLKNPEVEQHAQLHVIIKVKNGSMVI